MVTAVIATGAAFAGFLAGLTTFKRSLTWCKACGTTLTCSVCTGQVRRRLKAGA
jgi:hypothetical protein